MSGAILPGATIGVLGSGQLGRMFALEARRMGYRVHTLSPDMESPTGQIADKEVTCAYDDLDAVRAFAREVDVITFEFENVLSQTTEAAAEFAPVRPGGNVLHVTQHRLREKTFLQQHGFPTAPWRAIRSRDDLQRPFIPAVLKTAGWGYDGKGQFKIERADQIDDAWAALDGAEGVLEGYIDFAYEVSVIGARGLDGAFTHFGLLENIHVNHILDVTLSPARLPAEVEAAAVEITRGVMEQLDVAGVLCVEFFVTRDGKLLVNELAPRPHNSGHVTFDNRVTSQFEQQLRAICGLPLGSTEITRPAAMANLLGDLWQHGEPKWPAALAFPDVKLHLYGKAAPRPGRKMGHLTALANTIEEAYDHVLVARAALTQNS